MKYTYCIILGNMYNKNNEYLEFGKEYILRHNVHADEQHNETIQGIFMFNNIFWETQISSK